MVVGEKGQVTIPIEARRALGLHPGSVVEFERRGDELVMRKSGGGGRGAALVERLRGPSRSGLSTDADGTHTWMSVVLVDANIIIDIRTKDSEGFEWSAGARSRTAADRHELAINPIIYAEVSVDTERLEELEQDLPPNAYHRLPLPYEATFLAGKAFLRYRRAGGRRRSPLPDFYIGAQADGGDMIRLTRDASRYGGYFPTVELISPETT